MFVSFGLKSSTNRFAEIEWKKDYKLSWKDFRKTNKKHHYDALSSTGIAFSYVVGQKGVKVEAKAIFDRSESWVRKGRETESLLEHEQLHFDIAELYTRKLREKIERDNITTASGLDKVYNRIVIDLRKRQRMYDQQTDHGINKKEQMRWQEEIANQLKIATAYS